jgi:hypothetical protein
MLEQAASGAPRINPSAERREAAGRRTGGGGGLIIPFFHSATRCQRRPNACHGGKTIFSCAFGHNVGNWLTKQKGFWYFRTENIGRVLRLCRGGRMQLAVLSKSRRKRRRYPFRAKTR